MANPLPTAMTWEDHQTMISTILNGQSVDQTLLTQMLNEARTGREGERDWFVLQNVDQSLTWSPGDTWQTSKAIPTNFKKWIERNPIQVWDGSTANPTVIPIKIIPFEDRLYHYSDNYIAAIDYANNLLYMMGKADKQYTLVLTYMKENGDIVPIASNNNVATSWMGIPARFHKILSYDVAAMYRLGVSWDELAASNAQNNDFRAQNLMKAMRKWDADLSRASIRNQDYYPIDYPSYTLHKINIWP